MQTGGRWSMNEASNHINYLELLAAFLALQCFAKQKHNTTILLKMDNVTAVTYINKMGGTQSEGLCLLALTIWNWCLQQNIFLIAEYLPGGENTVADEESRNMMDRCDWMLNPRIFRHLYNEAWGTETSCMAYLRESFTSRGVSTEASDLLLSSWRTKTKSNYNSCFPNGWIGVS